MSSYKVEGRSRKDLRDYAYKLREITGYENKLYFPVVEFLEIMPKIFQNFNYEIEEDSNFEQGIHAYTDIANHCIVIRESVYDGACSDNGRDRMTIAHEIGHYLTLVISGFKLARNFENKQLKAYEDPEWQAKCFAGELLVPNHLVSELTTDEVAEKCCVSYKAAELQLSTK